MKSSRLVLRTATVVLAILGRAAPAQNPPQPNADAEAAALVNQLAVFKVNLVKAKEHEEQLTE
jgi:hypothetical protein